MNCRISVEDFDLNILRKYPEIHNELKNILARMHEPENVEGLAFEIGSYQEFYDYDDEELEESQYEYYRYNEFPSQLELLENIDDTQYTELIEFLSTNIELQICHVYAECEREY